MRKMWISTGLLVAGLVLGLAVTAQATLIGRGLFDDGFGGFVNLIYDDDINVTWLGDANFSQTSGFDADGGMNWTTANTWAGGLTVGGFSDWRLPTTANPDPSCSSPFGPFGFGCTGSEMGHLFNVEGISSTTSGLFTNVQNPSLGLNSTYWSSSDNTGFPPSFAFAFNFTSGQQSTPNKGNGNFAWALRTGDVPPAPSPGPAPVPEPSTILLLGSGLIGLIWCKKRMDAKS